MSATAAELHLLGQLTGASDFPLSTLFCKFAIEAGSNFRLLQGVIQGQTQCDQPNVSLARTHAHARAIRLTPAPCAAGGGDGGLGAPDRCALHAEGHRGLAKAQARGVGRRQLRTQRARRASPHAQHTRAGCAPPPSALSRAAVVASLDLFVCPCVAVGYGVCMLPTSPGVHELRCTTWRPCGSMREQLSSAR